MPEGHVLHRLAASIETTFGGRRVTVTSPQGRFADAAQVLSGSVLEAAEAHGKHLLIGFGPGRTVHVHLGLYGNLQIGPGPGAPPRGALRMRIATPETHADLRGPTRCALIDDDEVATLHDRLGPDPLRGDDPTPFVTRIERSVTPIGRLLMDQTIAAGVGNIYRAEALFRAGLDPMTPGRDLRPGVAQGLWADLVTLMTVGLRSGRIDTVRDEHLPEVMGRDPRVDDHGGEVYVYRRDGQPCLVCGSEIRTRVEAGRNLFWCPRCQRRTRPCRPAGVRGR